MSELIKVIAEAEAKGFASNELAQANAWLDDMLKRGQGLPASEIVSLVEEISPIRAYVILKRCNPANRRFRAGNFRRHVEAMKSGRWRLIQQGISFNIVNLLDNGQHRLAAILASGVVVRMCVTVGQQIDAFDVIDSAMSTRSAEDTLTRAGFRSSRATAAAARLLNIIESGSFNNLPLPNHQVVNFVNDRLELVDQLPTGHIIAKELNLVPSAVSTGLYLINRDSKHLSRFDEFVRMLSTGVGIVTETNPVHKFRRLAKNNELESGKDTTTRALSIVISLLNTWNCFVKGVEVKKRTKILWNSDTSGSYPAVA